MARPQQNFMWIFGCVELAMEAGHKEYRACKMLSDFMPSSRGKPDFSVVFIRNNYRAMKERYGKIISLHRDEHLKEWEAKHRAWVAHLRSIE